jgi:predicted Zn-dependent protease
MMGAAAKCRPARLTRALALSLVLAVGACTSAPDDKQISLQLPQLTFPQQTARVESPSAEAREHARILASYGGVYENDRIQAMVTQLVGRLVAASERPNLKYEVTLLNSPAINAFALPNGHLYVTRGLIALSNDRQSLLQCWRTKWATSSPATPPSARNKRGKWPWSVT